MAFVSVTRLRVRSLRFLPQFLWYAYRTSRQAQRSPGFLGGALINDKRRTFWTITVWDGDSAMKAYRGAGDHAVAMTKLAHWCDEASVAHATASDAHVPTAAEAHRIMLDRGRASRVNHPSHGHTTFRIDAPTRPALPLKPAQQPHKAAA